MGPAALEATQTTEASLEATDFNLESSTECSTNWQSCGSHLNEYTMTIANDECDDGTLLVDDRSRFARMVILVEARALRRQKRTPIRTLISLAIISYILSSQIFMTALDGSIRLFSAGNCAPNQTGSPFTSVRLRSPIQLASANPAPVPLRAAASARSATSQRVPPVNGSMFGKRDLASGLVETRVGSSSEATRYNDIITEAIENFMARNSDGK
jgi:hypothetical protein